MENPLFTWNMLKEFNQVYQKHRKQIDNSVICGIRCEIKRSKSGEKRKLSRKECFDEAMTTLCGVFNVSVNELPQQKREVGQIEKVSPKLTEYQTAVFEVYGAAGFSDNDLMQSAWGIVLERYREQTKPTSIGEGFADFNRQLAEFKSNCEKTQDELRKNRAIFLEKIECVSKEVVEAREENKEQHRTTRDRVKVKFLATPGKAGRVRAKGKSLHAGETINRITVSDSGQTFKFDNVSAYRITGKKALADVDKLLNQYKEGSGQGVDVRQRNFSSTESKLFWTDHVRKVSGAAGYKLHFD